MSELSDLLCKKAAEIQAEGWDEWVDKVVTQFRKDRVNYAESEKKKAEPKVAKVKKTSPGMTATENADLLAELGLE